MNVDPHSIAVVVPAYNEAQQVAAVLRRLLERHYTVVAVDDGSTDGTWAVLQSLPVHRLRHSVNLGQGAALETGVQFAIRRGAAYIVHFDADGQHQVEDVDRLIEPLATGPVDIVLGSRFLAPAPQSNVPPIKYLLLCAGVLLNGLLTGLWLSDAHNGLRAMTRAAARRIHLQENGYAHASEILGQIRAQQLRYVERPTNVLYTPYSRRKGQSVWNAVSILIDLLLRKVLPS